MKIDAATKTVDKAEARERKKAIAAVQKWLPLRLAQLALAGEGVDATKAPDAEHGEKLHALLIARGLEDMPEEDAS